MTDQQLNDNKLIDTIRLKAHLSLRDEHGCRFDDAMCLEGQNDAIWNGALESFKMIEQWWNAEGNKREWLDELYDDIEHVKEWTSGSTIEIDAADAIDAVRHRPLPYATKGTSAKAEVDDVVLSVYGDEKTRIDAVLNALINVDNSSIAAETSVASPYRGTLYVVSVPAEGVSSEHPGLGPINEMTLKIMPSYLELESHRIDMDEYDRRSEAGVFCGDITVAEYKAQRAAEEEANKKSGGCFLTSACVDALGKEDDCYELSTLREFRDGWLSEQEGGKDDIARYYAFAPLVVSEIDGLSNRIQVYAAIYDELVAPCVKLIEEGRMQEAWELYRSYIEKLIEKYAVAAA